MGALSLLRLWRLADRKESRLIVALDLPGEAPISEAARILSSLGDLACGVKIGLPLLLGAGPDKVAELIDDFRDDYFFIADPKVAESPHITTQVVRRLASLGFEAVIVHLFQGGLEGPREAAQSAGVALIGVLMMPHRGVELFEQCFNELLSRAASLKLDGVIVGATKPRYIRRAREVLPRGIAILAPGVIVQGAQPGSAIREGADFEVVGRAIVRAEDPAAAAKRIVEAERAALRAR